MSRALATIVHVVLGLLFWIPLVGVVAAFTNGMWPAALWVGSMLALWLVALGRMSSGPSPSQQTFLWWLVSFIAPLWVLVELF